MSDRCEIEHMLFFIFSNVCHRLSNACSTLAIVSSFDDVRALDGALSIAPELSVTPSSNDEQDIRHINSVIFKTFSSIFIVRFFEKSSSNRLRRSVDVRILTH